VKTNIIDSYLKLKEYKNVTGETIFYSAEGATTPETLRQKDRYRNNSGKQA
jgi:hypothetical protein